MLNLVSSQGKKHIKNALFTIHTILPTKWTGFEKSYSDDNTLTSEDSNKLSVATLIGVIAF